MGDWWDPKIENKKRPFLNEVGAYKRWRGENECIRLRIATLVLFKFTGKK